MQKSFLTNFSYDQENQILVPSGTNCFAGRFCQVGTRVSRKVGHGLGRVVFTFAAFMVKGDLGRSSTGMTNRYLHFSDLV